MLEQTGDYVAAEISVLHNNVLPQISKLRDSNEF